MKVPQYTQTIYTPEPMLARRLCGCPIARVPDPEPGTIHSDQDFATSDDFASLLTEYCAPCREQKGPVLLEKAYRAQAELIDRGFAPLAQTLTRDPHRDTIRLELTRRVHLALLDEAKESIELAPHHDRDELADLLSLFEVRFSEWNLHAWHLWDNQIIPKSKDMGIGKLFISEEGLGLLYRCIPCDGDTKRKGIHDTAEFVHDQHGPLMQFHKVACEKGHEHKLCLLPAQLLFEQWWYHGARKTFEEFQVIR